MANTNNYPPCKHIKKPTLNVQVTEDIAIAIGRDYRTLPIFEKGLQEYTNKKLYSLQTNELLKCRWLEYKKHIDKRVIAPFEFLDIRDYHFYNCRNRLIASQSIFKKGDYQMKLRPGPGVDFRGQIPIPQELLMKRSGQKKQKKLSTVEAAAKEKIGKPKEVPQKG